MEQKIGIIGTGVAASLIALEKALENTDIQILNIDDIDRGIVINDTPPQIKPFVLTNPYEGFTYSESYKSKPKHRNSKSKDINKERAKNKKARKARKINRKH